MSASLTPLEALRRLIAAVKLIDFADCKDERVWNQLGGELGVAEGVVRGYVEPAPIAYANAAFFISRKSEFAQNGTVIFPAKCGEVTMPLYADPVTAQPSRTVLGDEIIAALDALQTGCTEPSWIGWENGEGEEVGTRLQAAIDAYRAAPTAAVSAAPSGEVKRDAARLDFVEAHPEKQLRCVKKRWAFVGFTNYPYEVFGSVRQAIDAAITATKE